MNDINVDVNKSLRSLKDFQRKSVDYIFRRMYLDAEPTSRFLLADEVGLGKTMVARGIVAKAIDHLKDKVERIDVLYICSNLDIARQNIARLNVTGQEDFSLASRITLLPQTVSDLKTRRLNFITFTPGTSFELASNLGTVTERALLHQMLSQIWELRGTGPLNILQGNASTGRFRNRAREAGYAELDESLLEAFKTALENRIQVDRSQGSEDIRSRFEALCKDFGYARTNIPQDQHRKRIEIVGQLRGILAASCIEALQPDLIILDEFQRFRDILDGDDDASVLARNLFSYRDVRLLLLSATPYKMYTLTDDSGGEDHYRDFVRTYRFLAGDDAKAAELETLLASFRRELVAGSTLNLPRLRDLKEQIEARLRLVMCRTERLASDTERGGMLVQMPAPTKPMSPSDLQGYVSLQRVADTLEEGDVLEYWKSTPYALNFMNEYKLKDSFVDSASDPALRAEIAKLLSQPGPLLLDWNAVGSYAAIDPANARVRHVIEDTIGRGAWKTLWMPPSLPYYRPGPPFDTEGMQKFTKRLVFSCWKVVPKVIAALLSYEAERLMTASSVPDARNTPEERKKRRPLLRYAVSEGQPTGMPVLALSYPSEALARLCDPLDLASRVEAAGLPDDGLILQLAEGRIERELRKLDAFAKAPQDGSEDEAWYWAAPILLDAREKDGPNTLFWESKDWDLAATWADGDEDTEEEQPGAPDEEASAWERHVNEARRAFRGEIRLGRPPSDLVRVLALLALAAPGNVALRALQRVAKGTGWSELCDIRLDAARMGFRFPALFNQPESMALIRGLTAQEPYWRRVLEYCFAGNLQAVLDEYCHILRDSGGVMDKQPAAISSELADTTVAAMSLRAASVGVDCLQSTESGQSWKNEPRSMNLRFALRYGDEKSEDGIRTRADQVRKAFNSPFWPFVLATTSVGQEGLDFHHYCHAVVHWNLPSNPVDLEQREGRVHRYKGHAVRKNVTRLHSSEALAKLAEDPWEEMFSLAHDRRPAGATDVFPYWLLPTEGGACIERHVLTPPLSREQEHLSALRRSLAIYRMVFGQARQEELLEYLRQVVPETELAAIAAELRVDLSPQVI